MDSFGFWSTSNLSPGWRSPYIGSVAVILPQTGPMAAIGQYRTLKSPNIDYSCLKTTFDTSMLNALWEP